jgi:hypothetical protein
MTITMDFMLGKKQITRKLTPKEIYEPGPLRDVNAALVTVKLE